MRFWTGLLAALVGCEGEKPRGDTGPADSGEPAGPIACEDLDPGACDARCDCAAIDGRPMGEEEGQLCVDYGDLSQRVGCRDAGPPCGEEETLAAPPGDPGTCWIFSNTCVPTGWIPCESEDYGECAEESTPDTPCAELDPQACHLREDCAALEAYPVLSGPDGACCEAPERVAVGCQDRATPCEDHVGQVGPPGDPSQCFVFSSLCFPAGWEACAAECDADSAPWDYATCECAEP